MHVVIQHVSQLVSDPLRHGRGQVLLGVRTERSDDGYGDDGRSRDVEHVERIARHPLGKPVRHSLGAKHVVEHDFERPRLEQVRGALHEHRDEGDRQQLPVRPQQTKQTQAADRHGVLPGCVRRVRRVERQWRATRLTKSFGVSA